jgi:Family of unknown function (DUF6314)
MVGSEVLVSPGELAGEWSFRRRLADLRTGRFGSAEGTLTVDATRQLWSESGELAWSGRRAPVSRTMGFTRIEDEWWMTFADGSHFHPWRLNEMVQHDCRADVYRGLLVLDQDADRLRIGWDVVGPAKHERIVTRYRRLAR